MAETLSHTATVGPFFSVRTNAGAPREQGFLPLPELYRQDSSPALHKRVEVVAARLGTTEQRVAASLVHQGLAGRLWSIALAPAALAGRVPDLGDDTLWWHPARSVPDEFWLPAPTTRPSPPEEDLTSRLRAAVVQGHLVPLQRAISTVCPISPRLLRGNAASALVGALRVLDGWCRRTGRKEAAERAVALTAAVLDDPLLRGSGTLDPAVPQFSRRSCCLYYRVPGGGLCGDCVLRRAGR